MGTGTASVWPSYGCMGNLKRSLRCGEAYCAPDGAAGASAALPHTVPQYLMGCTKALPGPVPAHRAIKPLDPNTHPAAACPASTAVTGGVGAGARQRSADVVEWAISPPWAAAPCGGAQGGSVAAASPLQAVTWLLPLAVLQSNTDSNTWRSLGCRRSGPGQLGQPSQWRVPRGTQGVGTAGSLGGCHRATGPLPPWQAQTPFRPLSRAQGAPKQASRLGAAPPT